MKNLTEILEEIKPLYLELLNNHCIIFKVIGTPPESPTWYQYREIFTNDKDRTFLKFRSSQRNSLGFDIDITEIFKANPEAEKIHFTYSIIYDYFRDIKRKFIKEEHSTIKLNP